MFGIGTGASTQPTTVTTSAPGITSVAGIASTSAATSTSSTIPAAPAQATSSLATTSATPSATTNLSQLNFRQIQDYINKWTAELQEQETLFIENATKVNAWDRSVMENGEKISKLNAAVDTVRTEHTKLERDLDYLKTQQQEFEALLEPLESSLPPVTNTEPEREHLYSLAENTDVQLQQMAEDLKEIIRHINDSNKPLDKSDPVSQIMKILNEHTDALQWVEDNSNGLKKQLDEVSEVHKAFRQDQEKSLRGMFKY